MRFFFLFLFDIFVPRNYGTFFYHLLGLHPLRKHAFFFFTYHGKYILLFIHKDLGVATQFYRISRFILKALLTTGDS